MDSSLECRLTNDTNFILYLMGDLWDETCEDGALFSQHVLDPHFTWVEFLNEDGKQVGAFNIRIFNSTTIEFHIQILKKYRKKYTGLTADALHKWLSSADNVTDNFKKLIAYIPCYFANVQDFATRSGWDIQGTLTDAYTKEGQLYDINIYGANLDELRDKWAVQ
jgi:RimJ/RimL family protein N-acetyltransferase